MVYPLSDGGQKVGNDLLGCDTAGILGSTQTLMMGYHTGTVRHTGVNPTATRSGHC